MKRFITTLIFILLSFGLFAENGYAGKKWGTSKEDLELTYSVDPKDDVLWGKTSAEKKPMLGSETMVYYHFFENVLLAISYRIPNEKAALIKRKLNELIFETPTATVSADMFLIGMNEMGFLPEINDKDLDLCYLMAVISLDAEISGYDEIKGFYEEKGNGLITIYDYNEDTRCYVYENLINGTTIIVYTYHEQDF